MTRLAALLTGLVVALAGLGLYTPSATADDASGPAIFFVAHQDDDVLSHGAAIKQHLAGGREVRVVLMTDGSSSGICDQDGNGTISATERVECTAQRDAEFVASMEQIGAVPEIPANRAQDGRLTPSLAKSIILDYLTLYPHSSLKGHTYKESIHCSNCNNGTSGVGHADHDAVGEGLRQVYNDGYTDVRFYVKPDMWTYWPGTNDIGSWHDRYVINAALDMYGPTAPDSPLSTFEPGIGQRSSNTFCEQYGGDRASLPTLPNGRTCSLPRFNYNGAHSYYHLPGK